MAATAERWREGIESIQERRASYSDERKRYYERIAREACEFFGLRGWLLDIGCGTGWMRRCLPGVTEYVGIDSEPLSNPDFTFREANAERLPFVAYSFDSALCYSVLQHVIDPATVLTEAARILKPGGRLGLLICIDGNPIFLNHWDAAGCAGLIGCSFEIERSRVLDGKYFLAVARKPKPRRSLRIAFVTFMFPAWSETFIRRSVQALHNIGHDVRVFTKRGPDGPPVPGVDGVLSVPWDTTAVQEFAPDLLYGSLSIPAHRRTVELSRDFGVPFVLRVWSGLDSFAYPSPHFYSDVTHDPLCSSVIVEDAFMWQWAVQHMAINPDKLTTVPNSIYPDDYASTVRRDPSLVLSVARFVPKKGLVYLVRAMRSLPGLRLELVGAGPEETLLRRAANSRVTFSGVVPESRLPPLYASASIYAAPCVCVRNGDADGIPTTVLEAMASGCAIIASDLYSMKHYIADGVTGLLVRSGHIPSLAKALQRLHSDPGLVRRLGDNARQWARENVDIRRNIHKIDQILQEAARFPSASPP